jgi:Hsp20/alpha crystallin family
MIAEDRIKHKHVPTAHPDSKSKFEKLLKKVSDSGHLSQRNKQDLGRTENGTSGSVDGLTECSLSYTLKERKSGLLQRSFTLPLEIISDSCRSKLEHGLLKIDVPKRVVQEKQEERLTLDDT